MPTDTINDQSIPENLKRLLKIHADAYIEIQKKIYHDAPREIEDALQTTQTELLFKLLIAHVTCEGLSHTNYQ